MCHSCLPCTVSCRLQRAGKTCRWCATSWTAATTSPRTCVFRIDLFRTEQHLVHATLLPPQALPAACHRADAQMQLGLPCPLPPVKHGASCLPLHQVPLRPSFVASALCCCSPSITSAIASARCTSSRPPCWCAAGWRHGCSGGPLHRSQSLPGCSGGSVLLRASQADCKAGCAFAWRAPLLAQPGLNCPRQ